MTTNDYLLEWSAHWTSLDGKSYRFDFQYDEPPNSMGSRFDLAIYVYTKREHFFSICITGEADHAHIATAHFFKFDPKPGAVVGKDFVETIAGLSFRPDSEKPICPICGKESVGDSFHEDDLGDLFCDGHPISEADFILWTKSTDAQRLRERVQSARKAKGSTK